MSFIFSIFEQTSLSGWQNIAIKKQIISTLIKSAGKYYSLRNALISDEMLSSVFLIDASSVNYRWHKNWDKLNNQTIDHSTLVVLKMFDVVSWETRLQSCSLTCCSKSPTHISYQYFLIELSYSIIAFIGRATRGGRRDEIRCPMHEEYLTSIHIQRPKRLNWPLWWHRHCWRKAQDMTE